MIAVQPNSLIDALESEACQLVFFSHLLNFIRQQSLAGLWESCAGGLDDQTVSGSSPAAVAFS